MHEHGVLEGVRVLEFATLVAGPAAGSYLSQLGADVVKVEPLGGDPSRGLVAPSEKDTVAPPFLANNIGKRSIIVDLKRQEGVELAGRLLQGADVVLENFRPGVLDGIGLSIDKALKANTSLVWISIRGYGPNGEWRNRPAVDGIIQADSGMVDITGYPDQPGVKVGFPVVDHAAAHVITSVVLAALLRRHRAKAALDARHHVVALFDVALSMQATGFTDFLLTGRSPKRLGNASQLSAPNESLRASDGRVMMAAYLPQHWTILCRVLGCTELTNDPRFLDRLDRMQHRQALIDEIERHTTKYTAEQLFHLLDDAGLMVGIIRQYDEVAICEQVVANDLLVDVSATQGGRYRALRPLLDSFGIDTARTICEAGEHTSEVLAELGLSSAEVESLALAGVIHNE